MLKQVKLIYVIQLQIRLFTFFALTVVLIFIFSSIAFIVSNITFRTDCLHKIFSSINNKLHRCYAASYVIKHNHKLITIHDTKFSESLIIISKM